MTVPELALLEDLAKLANNIGVEFAGPSSNETHQRCISQLRAIFERWDITSPRIHLVLDRARARISASAKDEQPTPPAPALLPDGGR